MAIPFEQKENSDTTKEILKKAENQQDLPATQKGSKSIPSSSYYISNSKLSKIGPTFVNLPNVAVEQNALRADLTDGRLEAGRRIRVRKGIFISKRIINSEDIQIVCEDVKDDWKILLKKLPGVTFNNSSFHQSFINAMDRNDSTNMAEIALTTWKNVLPELSTVGNLSKTLFNIGHPDIVTYLRP